MYELHFGSILLFFGIPTSHFIVATIASYYYYNINRSLASVWKLQPLRWDENRLVDFDRMPIVQLNHPRKPYYLFLLTINIFITGLFSAVTFECILHGYSTLYCDTIDYFNVNIILISPLKILLFYEIVSYANHRMMHTKWLYNNIHSVHHRSNHPEPFDATYHHPVEFLLNECVRLLPAFVFHVHVLSFVIYIVGMTSLTANDHLGAKKSSLYIYNSQHHDDHHKYINCNYGEFKLCDWLFSTFHKDTK
jgi:sterol desaturase/sphingolipid hydroxylase (fatty acid hydroxylase superfamily)